MLLRNESLAARVELMEDVQQRLLMHLLVLENRVGGLRAAQQRARRIVDRGFAQRAFDAFVAVCRERRHGSALRPLAAVVAAGLGQRRGIDAPLEEPLECRVIEPSPSARTSSVRKLNAGMCPS